LDLRIKWQPKQRIAWRLWDDQVTTRLGIGGARGGTKSGFLRRGCIARRWKYPKTTGLLLRRTLPELESSHLLKLFEEFPELRPYYHDQKKMLRFPNGSIQFFASAQTPKDVAKFYSSEYADIGIDEAQEFTQDEMERLAGSNRCTSNVEILPKMIYTFMPGVSDSGVPPKGLPYLKRVLVDGELRGEEREHTWAFLQAFAWDNIEWARVPLEKDGVSDAQFYSWPESKRRDYFLSRTVFGKQLKGLTDKNLRNAWLHGKWDVFPGQYFTNFSYAKHTAPATAIHAAMEPWFEFWVSGDWGDDHPCCYHLHCRDRKGHIFTLLEWGGREKSEEEMGKGIGAMCRAENLGMKPGPLNISAFPLSWDAFGRLSKATRRSIPTMIKEALPDNVPFPVPADASPGTRVSGWRHMKKLLNAGMWTISREGCPKLIECIPTLMRDMERNSEDVLKVDYSENYIGDDPADSARMGLQHMMEPADVPPDIQAAERLEELEKEVDQYGRPLSKTAVMMRQAFQKPIEPPGMPWRIGDKR
jgi:hypothetical protein